jgi:hypothetical protein
MIAKPSLEDMEKEPSKFEEFMKTISTEYITFAQLAEEFHVNPPYGQSMYSLSSLYFTLIN